jgi:hypothetical protein
VGIKLKITKLKIPNFKVENNLKSNLRISFFEIS